MNSDVAQKVTAFFDQFRSRHYPKGQVLILNDDEVRDIYFIEKGRVKQYDVSYRGDEIVLNVFKPGAFFPMSFAINGGKSPHIFEAETAIDVRQAPAKAVVAFLRENPDVVFDLLSRLYRGTDGLLERMAHLMAGNAKSRLMLELVVACRRYGEQHPDGSRSITLTEGELGARSGLTRETVSREMRKLRDSKLLTIDRGTITVFDLDDLESKLHKSL